MQLDPKGSLKALVPERLLNARRRLLNRRADRAFLDKSPEEIFSRVYRTSEWSRSDEDGRPFYSGTGSHDGSMVDGYSEPVTAFLASLDHKPDAVDLGCGDFNIGSRIRPFCGRYVACDVVADLIEHNEAQFGDLDVEFRRVDITRDPLPAGEVVFLRQVLQHLSNEHIGLVVQKLQSSGYRYLVLTEELPRDANFVPNVDKPTGPGTRTGRGTPDSGVVLTAAPFNLPVKSEEVLWETDAPDPLFRTTVYELC